MVILLTLRERCFFSFHCNGYIDNVTGTLTISLVVNGYIDNVTGTLTFSLVLNGYTDNVTRTLTFSLFFNGLMHFLLLLCWESLIFPSIWFSPCGLCFQPCPRRMARMRWLRDHSSAQSVRVPGRLAEETPHRTTTTACVDRPPSCRPKLRVDSACTRV